MRRLLDAALEVHDREGPDGFTVHAVTKASGISAVRALHGRAAGRDRGGTGASRNRPRRGTRGRRFVKEQPDRACFIHASAYASYLPAHAPAIAEMKTRMQAWLAPHIRAGSIVDLPDPLTEMLLIGPIAELSRRWLAGATDIDLTRATKVLPDRIWASLRP